MCLSNVSRRFKPNDRIKIGYKVFKANSKKTFSGLFQHNHKNPFRLGNCYQDTLDEVLGNEYYKNHYDSGFHCFLTLKSAKEIFEDAGKNHMIVKVLAWDIRAIGKQNGRKIFVAKNIRPVEIIQSNYKKVLTTKQKLGRKYRKEMNNIEKIIALCDEGSEDSARELYLNCFTESFEKFMLYSFLVGFTINPFSSEAQILEYIHFYLDKLYAGSNLSASKIKLYHEYVSKYYHGLYDFDPIAGIMKTIPSYQMSIPF